MTVIASFPKSGNTWVRFLIANIYNNVSKIFDEIDFYNIHDIIPELGNEQKYFNKFPQLYKTHGKYESMFDKAILVLRNSWDTLLSYYYYLNVEKNVNINFKDMVIHEQYGIKSIVNHTNSYTKNCTNLLIITYERLKRNSLIEIKKICYFLDINVEDWIINEAINKSSFDVMKQIEINKGRKFGNPNYQFVREGQIGKGKLILRENRELDNYIIAEMKNSVILDNLYCN